MNPAPSMDSAGSEIRIYRLSGAALVEAVRLDAIAPPRAVEGALHAPEADSDHGDGAGADLFISLVQGGIVVDIARLLFRGGEPSDADGGQDSYSSNPSTSDDTAVSGSGSTDEVLQDVSSKYTDEALTPLYLGGGGLMMSFEDDQWINPPSKWEGEGEEECEGDEEEHLTDERCFMSATGKPSSCFWTSGNHDSSSENEDQDQDGDQDQEALKNCDEDWGSTSVGHVNDDSRNDNQDQDQEQNQEEDNESEKDVYHNHSLQINLRLWPLQKHAVIKIFSGGKWVLTKDYILGWMKPEDVIEYNLQVEFGASFANALVFRDTDCTMDFKVNMDCTPMLKNLMTLVKPSICNFQIIKKVGGRGACKVFKCLFTGKKCALKSLAQKYPCTLEPREIEIIANLKDTHVMIFYQAWIEPWLYKGNAEQEYLFIHLEFCQSTLKHALLYENRHWFPDKWLLFREIVGTVHKLHEAFVVHRDLKPDNIFFNSELAVLLGDFGDACVGRDETGLYGGGTPKLGTQYYFANELNSGEKITEKRSGVFPNLSEQGPPHDWDGDHKLYDMMTALEPSDRPSTAQVLAYIDLYHSE